MESSYCTSYSDQNQQEVLLNLFKFIRTCSEMGQRGVKDKTNSQTLYINVLKYSFLYTFMLIYMFCINYNTLIPYTDDF